MNSGMANTAIWWIRRDLRLAGNPSLSAAFQNAEQIIPLFIVDPVLVNSKRVGEKRLEFLWGGLQSLDNSLRERGSYLVVRKGIPAAVLTEVIDETGAEKIFAQGDYTPFALRRDKRIRDKLPLKFIGSSGLAHPGEILKNDGSPYTVFTPYKKKWMAEKFPLSNELITAPEKIATPQSIKSEKLEYGTHTRSGNSFKPGESEARRLLDLFTNSNSIFEYYRLRNRMDLPGTSQLSPYLRFGMLSPQLAFQKAADILDTTEDKGGIQGVETWVSELIWREFYLSILYHFPEVMEHSFRENLRHIEWVNNEWEFEKWCRGETGFPVVDAGMRQMVKTGWMHNRARMISASFLVKDLLVDWRWGELFFMQHLVDGDSAANNGGWQWTAGTGTDAAPYFRIFNPVTQGEKFDPLGNYVRRWVPELQQVPEAYIHKPWEMPQELQKQAGCRIGIDYPEPIIDHQYARQRTLDAFQKAKNS